MLSPTSFKREGNVTLNLYEFLPMKKKFKCFYNFFRSFLEVSYCDLTFCIFKESVSMLEQSKDF